MIIALLQKPERIATFLPSPLWNYLALYVLVLAVAAGWMGWNRRNKLRRIHPSPLTVAGIAAAAAIFGATYLPLLYHNSYSFWGILLLAGIVLFVTGLARIPFFRLLYKAAARGVRLCGNIPSLAFVLMLALAFLIAADLASGILFGHLPHINDTVNQYVHAKFIASGHWTGPAPRYPDFFLSGFTIISGGKWYSPYPPGHLLLLALGQLAGKPWLVNPILGALTLIAVFLLARETHGKTTAKLSALLFAVSPLTLFLSAEYMNHATSLLFSTLFFLWFILSVRRRHKGYAALAGAALGMVAITRPLTALGVCIPYAAWALFLLGRDFRRYIPIFLLMGAMLACFLAFQLYFNAETTGDPFLYGYVKLHGPAHNPGFGIKMWGVRHTPLIGLTHTAWDMFRMNMMLFEWKTPCLFLALLAFLSLTRNPYDYLYALTVFSLAGAYILSQFNDGIFGPRYIYESVGPLLILSVQGILRMPVLMRLIMGQRVNMRVAQGGALVLVLMMFCLSWPETWPARAHEYAEHYWEGDQKFYWALLQQAAPPALVFVPSDQYLKVAFTNPPTANTPVIFARDLGSRNQLLISEYPGRTAYIEHDGKLQLLNPSHAPPSAH